MLVVFHPGLVSAAWFPVATEQGKRVEIDRESIQSVSQNEYTAKGRIVLDKPIVDPKTSSSYRIIEVFNRFDCSERTYATLKRTYFREEGDLLRQEEIRSPFEMPVRSGTPDDRMLRDVCRPRSGGAAIAAAGQTVEKVGQAAGELRKLNDDMVEKAVQKDLKKILASGTGGAAMKSSPAKSRTSPALAPDWAYAGEGGPEKWASLRSEYALCASGRRQSPIDLSDGIAVDLDPLEFSYAPTNFRVSDSGKSLQVAVQDGSFSVLGMRYQLMRIHFHRPSEHTIGGRVFEMEVRLIHRSAEGKLAIVSVLLETGQENPVIQSVLNHLPLERGGEVSPPALLMDLNRLLPVNRGYFTFMGSLTAPPCSEDVLWMVFKQPQAISPEQLSIFQRIYPPNARPVQARAGRIIKESR